MVKFVDFHLFFCNNDQNNDTSEWVNILEMVDLVGDKIFAEFATTLMVPQLLKAVF